jgi:hypothetical protein
VNHFGIDHSCVDGNCQYKNVSRLKPRPPCFMKKKIEKIFNRPRGLTFRGGKSPPRGLTKNLGVSFLSIHRITPITLSLSRQQMVRMLFFIAVCLQIRLSSHRGLMRPTMQETRTNVVSFISTTATTTSLVSPIFDKTASQLVEVEQGWISFSARAIALHCRSV